MIKLLQKAQLKQYKISQNFLTSPVLAAPNASPLPTVALQKSLICWNLMKSYANF